MKVPSFHVLKIGDFRRLLLVRMCGVMALQSQAVIVGWQIYSLTKDPLMLGLVGLIEAVPAILCALVSGYIVDISRPHRVFTLCIGALMLNTLMLLLLAGGVWHVGDQSVIPWIFAGVFFSGVARSFIMPSSFSLLPQIVTRHDIPAASAWMLSGFQVAAIVGPASAGLIYGMCGTMTAWLLPASLMLIAFLLLCTMSRATRQLRSQAVREPAVRSIVAGWRFIWRHEALLSVMALDMFAVLFGGVMAILPAYADQVLHTGSEGLGLLRAAPAVGAIGAALYLAMEPMQQIRGAHLLWVVFGFGLCMLGLGMVSHLGLALLLLALSGMFDSVSMVIRGTLMQLLTPEAMRGRVSSVNSMFIISSNEIGAFRAGSMAAWLGLVPSMVVGGIATLAVVLLTAWRAPALRRLVVDADAPTPPAATQPQDSA